MQDVLKELIEMVRTMSPVVWQAAIHAAQVEAVFDFIFSALLFVFAFLILKNLRIYNAAKAEDWNEIDFVMPNALGFALIVIFLIVGLDCLEASVTNFFVPEWRAVEKLLELVQ